MRVPQDRDDPVIGWVISLGVSALALFLRLWDLHTPQKFQFDETYYAKDAWSLSEFGYVRSYVEDADVQILEGTTRGLWTEEPSLVVHPEVGKWLIALGEMAFGMDPFGWRISAVLAGSLMVLVMVRLVARLTGSILFGAVAGLLLAVDGLHFVLSRIALLDIFMALFMLMGVSCMVADRDWFRRRLAGRADGAGGAVAEARGWGPVRGLLLRPWLLAAGVCWGLAVGTKWTALFPMAAFGLMVWIWSAGARRAHGVRSSLPKSALVDGIPAFVSVVVLGSLVYTATWTGWLLDAEEYEQAYSSTQYTRFSGSGTCQDDSFVDDGGTDARWPTADEADAEGLGEVWQSLRSLRSYHQDVYTFHANFLNCSDHSYASNPSGWLIVTKPVSVSVENDIAPGDQGCEARADSTCLRQVIILNNVVIWWGGALALLVSLGMWVGARDWRHGVAVVGAASTWLPWLRYDDRPIFSFYAVATLPFTILAITLAMGALLGPDRTPSRRRTAGVVVSGSFVVLAVLMFAWDWPVLTYGLLTRDEWAERIWFTRWI